MERRGGDPDEVAKALGSGDRERRSRGGARGQWWSSGRKARRPTSDGRRQGGGPATASWPTRRRGQSGSSPDPDREGGRGVGEIVGRGDRVRGEWGVARVSGTQGRLVEGAVGPAWRPGSLLGRGPIGGGSLFLSFFLTFLL